MSRKYEEGNRINADKWKFNGRNQPSMIIMRKMKSKQWTIEIFCSNNKTLATSKGRLGKRTNRQIRELRINEDRSESINKFDNGEEKDG